jgi:phosphohistidine swiveling domain-containing protein
VAERAGAGQVVSGGDQAAVGRFAALLRVEDLIAELDGPVERLVAFLAHPNVTMIAPLQPRLAAIVCETGDESAHVAIVSRELGLPCVVQFELALPLDVLEGREVTLRPDGTLVLEDRAGRGRTRGRRS